MFKYIGVILFYYLIVFDKYCIIFIIFVFFSFFCLLHARLVIFSCLFAFTISLLCFVLFLFLFIASFVSTYPMTHVLVRRLDQARMTPMRQWPTYSMGYKFGLSNMRILAWIVDRLWGNCIHLWVYKVSYIKVTTENISLGSSHKSK